MSERAMLDPVDLFEHACALLNAEAWPKAAALCDDASLEHFQGGWLRLARRRPAAAGEPDALIAPERAESLPPTEFFALWLDAHSPRRQMMRAVEAGTIPADAAEQAMPGFIAQWTFDAVGAVPDGERICHVLYRRPITDVDPIARSRVARERLTDAQHALLADLAGREWVGSVVCRRYNGRWGLIASEAFFASGVHIAGYGGPQQG